MKQIQNSASFPPISVLETWLLFLLSDSQQARIDAFIKNAEIHYFVNHFLQIVDNYPESIRTIQFQSLQHTITIPFEDYLYKAEQFINETTDLSQLISYYLKMVQVCSRVPLSTSLKTSLLIPFQKAIHKQTQWISSLFLVLSRDYSVFIGGIADLQNMLTNTNTNFDSNEEWSISRLSASAQIPPTVDLFHYLVMIAGSVEVSFE